LGSSFDELRHSSSQPAGCPVKGIPCYAIPHPDSPERESLPATRGGPEIVIRALGQARHMLLLSVGCVRRPCGQPSFPTSHSAPVRHCWRTRGQARVDGSQVCWLRDSASGPILCSLVQCSLFTAIRHSRALPSDVRHSRSLGPGPGLGRCTPISVSGGFLACLREAVCFFVSSSSLLSASKGRVKGWGKGVSWLRGATGVSESE